METLKELWRTSSINQQIAYALGATYVLVGVVGFAVTGVSGFAAAQGDELIIFGLNPLHNIVHIAVGALLLGGARATARASRGVNVLVGGVYAAVGLAGFFVLNSNLNILAINHPDNGLHIGSALVLLAAGLLLGGGAVRGTGRPATEDVEPPVRREVRADDRTKEELYERAQELGVDGRSQMDKAELRLAVRDEGRTTPSDHRESAALTEGDPAPVTGTYRCSCEDFAVFVREGYGLPQCPVGEGHAFTLTSRHTETAGQGA